MIKGFISEQQCAALVICASVCGRMAYTITCSHCYTFAIPSPSPFLPLSPISPSVASLHLTCPGGLLESWEQPKLSCEEEGGRRPKGGRGRERGEGTRGTGDMLSAHEDVTVNNR